MARKKRWDMEIGFNDTFETDKKLKYIADRLGLDKSDIVRMYVKEGIMRFEKEHGEIKTKD